MIKRLLTTVLTATGLVVVMAAEASAAVLVHMT